MSIKAGPLNPRPGRMPLLASGVVTAGWADGMDVALGVTVDTSKVGLVLLGHSGDAAYGIYGYAYLDATTSFKVYFPHGAFANSQRLPWALYDLSDVLRPGEYVQRGRTSFARGATTDAWTTKSTTLGTALGDYAAAHGNLLHFGRYIAGSGTYVSEAYPVITNATTLTFPCYEFSGADTTAFYISWEVWPLRD